LQGGFGDEENDIEKTSGRIPTLFGLFPMQIQSGNRTRRIRGQDSQRTAIAGHEFYKDKKQSPFSKNHPAKMIFRHYRRGA